MFLQIVEVSQKSHGKRWQTPPHQKKAKIKGYFSTFAVIVQFEILKKINFARFCVLSTIYIIFLNVLKSVIKSIKQCLKKVNGHLLIL